MQELQAVNYGQVEIISGLNYECLILNEIRYKYQSINLH